MSQQIEAVFENGVFRPLQPVDFPEHWRVTLHVPECDRTDNDNARVQEPATPSTTAPDEDEEFDEEIVYDPLPPDNVKTIPVKFRFIGRVGPIPYEIDEDELKALNELDES